MYKFLSIVGAAALAITVSMAAATPSSADSASDAVGAGLVGGVLGFMAGSALSDGPRHHRVYVDDGYDDGSDYDTRAHIRACFDAYHSYDLRSDTYLGYDGYSHQCDL